MRHGDLSNKGGVKIAFRLEDTILKIESHSTTAKIARKFNRMYGYEIDVGVMSVIKRIYANTDYNIVIVISRSNKGKKAVKDVLKLIPFCQEVYVHDERTSEISTNLLTKEWEYYVDDYMERRKSVVSPASVSLKDFLETCLKV